MKKLEQISIFLENKIGQLYETMDVLSNANIRIVASTVADTSEFGILRIITDDNEKAYQALREAHRNSFRSEVIAIACDSLADSFYKELRKFAAAGVVVEYMYCFSVKQTAIMILKANNLDLALQVALEEKMQVLSNEQLTKL